MYKGRSNSQVRTITPGRILNQLRTDIITQRYVKGDRLTETQLEQRFDASRGSVRVALQSLESEGLIHTLPNGRKEVLGFTLKQAKEIYDLRWMIENRAVECILADRPNFSTPMLTVLQRIETCAAEPDQAIDWFELDIDFHRALVQTSGNLPLLKAWEINSPIMYALLDLNTIKDYKEVYIQEFYSKHKKLFEYIVTENPKCFEELRIHILDAQTISSDMLNLFG